MYEPCIRGLAVAPQRFHSTTVAYQVGPTSSEIRPSDRPIRTWPEYCGEQERLWQVRGTVLEVVRLVEEPTEPLERQQILELGRPRSHMRLQITVSHMQSAEVYLLDLDQTLEVYARNVSVSVLAPIGAAFDPSPDFLIPAGLIADAIVTVATDKIEESRGSRTALLTSTVFVRSGDPADGVIPNGARALTIFPTVDPVTLQWYRGSPSAGGFLLGSYERTAPGPLQEAVPGASHWRISASQASNRNVTLVWTIQA